MGMADSRRAARHGRRARVLGARSIRRAAGLGVGLALIAAAPAAAYTGYVTNFVDDDVTVIDTTIGDVGATVGGDIAVGGEPVAVAAAPNGATAYVANQLGMVFPSGDVSVINTQTKTISGSPIELPDGGEGVGATAITPDGTHGYVVNPGSSSVTHFDTATRVAGLISVGFDPSAVAISPDGTEAYVTNKGTDPSHVSTIDAATNTSDPGDDVDVGGPANEAVAIAVTPDGDTAYVVNNTDDDVSVVDLTTDPPTDTGSDIAVGSAPTAIAINPAGTKAYVTNSDDSVSQIDLPDNVVADTIPLGPDRSPSAVAITPDGARAYVTNKGADEVAVINTSDNTLEEPRIFVGDEPTGIALFTVPPVTPPPPPAPTPPPLPDPIVGESFNLEPVEGMTTTRCPGEDDFRLLTSPTQVQVGCLVDATDGVVRLTSATGVGTETQTADFWAGRFKVLQNAAAARGAGDRVVPTTLALAGPLRKRSKVARASGEPVAHASKRKRKLWGKGKGKFKTKGKKGAASVRGTTWLTEDRSDGTTKVKVAEGKVKFRDFVKDRNVTVRSGEGYTAGS